MGFSANFVFLASISTPIFVITDRLKPVLIKAASFCAYQERYIKEVHQKLISWGLTDDEADEIIEELILQKYINETRFVKSFARGKFRHNHWGRIKIRQELKMRGLNNDLIKIGLAEIDGDEYEEVLKDLLEKKARSLKAEHPQIRQQKLIRFAVGKGFEMDIVWDLTKSIF